MLAYSLNKNMKNLKIDEGNAMMRKSRPKSAVYGRGPPVAKRKSRDPKRSYGRQAQLPP